MTWSSKLRRPRLTNRNTVAQVQDGRPPVVGEHRSLSGLLVLHLPLLFPSPKAMHFVVLSSCNSRRSRGRVGSHVAHKIYERRRC